MPRYDYRCEDCGHAFDVRMSMSEYSESNKPDCPNCGSENAERTFGSIGVLTGSSAASSGPSPRPAGCGHGGFT
jgi:putative FmdB family regulatory protein